MPLNKNIKRVLVIGSGPIVIGQAAEFDYAGTQALRALKEDGIEVVLVNSNPATIMTDNEMADKIYIEPLTLETVERIIKKEKPDSAMMNPDIIWKIPPNVLEKRETKNETPAIARGTRKMKLSRNKTAETKESIPVKTSWDAMNSRQKCRLRRYLLHAATNTVPPANMSDSTKSRLSYLKYFTSSGLKGTPMDKAARYAAKVPISNTANESKKNLQNIPSTPLAVIFIIYPDR